MSIALSILAVILFIAFLVGIVLGLFRRGRRRIGWFLAAGSFIALSATSNVLLSHMDQEAVEQGFLSASDKTAAKKAGVADPAAWDTMRAEFASNTEQSSEPVSSSANAQATATALAVSPSAFGADALAAYCEGYQQTLVVIREADDKFGIAGTDEKIDWINERDEAIGAETVKAIGAPYEEWQPFAQAERWDQRCEGMARGWLLMEIEDLAAATAGDAHVIQRTLQGVYDEKVELGAELPFSRYRFSTCAQREVEGYRLVGCKLMGGQNGLRSDPFLYFVGRKDGASVIVPFDNDHLTAPSYRDSDKNKTVMPMGWYVGPQPFPVPYGDIRAMFE